MKKLFVLFFISAFYMTMSAQSPVLKIDLNVDGRNNNEVNEPGYAAWAIGSGVSDTATFEGVNFVLSIVESTGGNLRGSWAKIMVQNPHYARLTCDGANIDYINQTIEAGGKLLLKISGLPIGDHTIQTMHNSWQDPATKAPSPMNVYLDSVLVNDSVIVTSRAISASEATTLLTVVHITADDQVVNMLFEAVSSFTPPEGVNPNYNVWLNAIEINTVDMTKLAKNPYPSDADMHVDADSGFLTMSWSPASANVNKHYLFFGTDLQQVENADTTDTAVFAGVKAFEDTTFFLADTYNLNTYYWRVDEMDKDGEMTKGTVWSFRPRHLAFRGAEGYGRYATGGRGGKVVYVTNLNDSGEGSFREAIANDIGPRTIVFNVSGIITLNSRLNCSSRYVTIAGQTAPGKGICLRSGTFGVGSEGICRFIRVRLGGGQTGDGLGMSGANHSITDHCSIGWTIDEAFSSRNAKNMTLQRSLISEALNVAGHKNYPEGSAHGYGATISGDVGSYHHNLLAHNEGRNWSLGGGLDGAGYYSGRLDIFNNVVYNWGGRATDGGAHEVNFVNNYYKRGAANGTTTILKAQLEGLGKGSQSYYYTGNVLENNNGTISCDGTDNTCSRTVQVASTQVVDWTVFVDEPFFPSYATIETASDAYKSILSDVGCTMPMFDEHDQRIVRETLTGTYTFVGSKTGKKGLIDNEADAGGYEDYPEESHPEGFDSDWDGLPDWWEILHGSNPHSPEGDFSDANADPDKDGYTALEDYLEWMSVPRYYMDKNSPKSIDLKDYTVAYTKNPQFTEAMAEDVSLSFSGSTVTLTPQADFTGISYFDFTVTDTDNSSMTRRIGIYVQEDTTTSIAQVQHKEFQFKVYPTTFSSELNIETLAAQSTSIALVLRDMKGQEILREVFKVEPGTIRLQVKCPSGLPAQLYLLELNDAQTGMKYDVKRLIKHP